MGADTVSRGTRTFVAVGVVAFVCWQFAAVGGYDRSATVALGLYGFVFHVVFGKAYSLLPSYFDRRLAFPRAPIVHLPLSIAGTVGLFVDAAGVGIAPTWTGFVGAVLWLLGCLVFVGTVGWSVRGNLAGAETGTGEVNAHRRRIDRVANAFVPLAVAYLLIGASLLVLENGGVGEFAGTVWIGGPQVSHVLAVGTGALLVFAIGFRLFPRFLVVAPRSPLVGVVLPAGSIAPALLAVDFLGGTGFRVGAILQALAVVGFAVAYADMYRRTDRERVGFHAVLAGAVCGVGAVLLGVHFAFGTVQASALEAHYRLALVGFLGLTIVGVTFQFYPPAIGSAPGVGDRAALLSIAFLSVGLAVEAGGLVGGVDTVARLGTISVAVGAVVYAYVVLSIFVERT